MKKIILVGILLPVLLNAQNQQSGVGVLLGEPLGISVKIWQPGTYDFNAVINNFEAYAKLWIYTKSFWLPKKNAWSLCLAIPVFPEGSYHIHGDYLWHLYKIFPPEFGMMPFYYGIGGRFRQGDSSHLGVRMVSGINYFIPGVPWDVFIELAPILDVKPEIGMDVNIGMGIRYNF